MVGRGASRLYSSEGTAARLEEDPQKVVDSADFDDLPDQGSYVPLSRRHHLRRLLDDIEEDDFYEPGAPAVKPRTHQPLGKPYSTKPPPLDETGLRPRLDVRRREAKGRQVHILGSDPKAYFIAHQLAGYEQLDPVKLLIHQKIIWNNWEREGRQLLMLKGSKRITRDRAVAEWIGRGKTAPSREPIEQLIVTLPCHATKRAIENILHRIDNRTTICLVQDGMGVVEELNTSLFQDPTKRPTFILGHLTASIGYHKQVFFSSMLRKPGKLYLTALERGTQSALPSYFKFHPPVERRPQGTQFLRTLVGTEGLGAGGYSLENYLIKKLPAMVFQCIIEPMAIALDTTYDQVLRNEQAILLADELLAELYNVIWALPELTNGSKVVEHCSMDALRRHTLTRLANKGASQSQQLSHVRAGKMVDIEYLNGYFVRRAKELGIKTPQNEIIIDVVKARIEGRQNELKGLVPFEGLDESHMPSLY